jgi:S1-C subfamily serine protease
VPAVVAIRGAAPRAFDTGTASSGVATGFVVDAELGLILTNRHVVRPGPGVAEAIFADHEEVELRAVYRDPVHDFGFFRYDPAEVRFMEPVALELDADAAHVGAEIRVVGNDAGEKLSILEGTLARLDREAPTYGTGNYNDFNTFYIQAASGTSGGSSGSPVIDIEGRVVALNAGSKRKSASSFYLPLDRVVRALDLIRRGEPVTRGTVQMTLRHAPYDELERLGLDTGTEADVREAFPDGTGMLVVDRTVPGGPAYGVLEPGDVLTAVDGRAVTTFLPVEELLDARVGQAVPFEVERGGQPLSLSVTVQDLHSITPDTWLEVGDAVLNTLSYQMARTRNVPAGGVYVADSGYMLRRAGINRGSVIVAAGEEPTPTLERFEEVFSAFADGEQVPIRFFTLTDPRRLQILVVTVDRRWHPMRRCVRDDATGSWPCTTSPEPGDATAAGPASLVYPPAETRLARKLAPSLVMVDYDIPYKLDGVYSTNFTGTGLVVDAERGLVVVDRDTVPVMLGDVVLTFAGSVELPGQVVWLHPIHNFGYVRYDPALLTGEQPRSATLSDAPLEPEDAVHIVGLTSSFLPRSFESKVTGVEPLALSNPGPPRYRGSNADVIILADQGSMRGGALADSKGRVRALWASYSYQQGKEDRAVFLGLPTAAILDSLAALQRGEVPVVRDPGFEVGWISLANARNRGLPDAQAEALARAGGSHPGVFIVLRRTAGSPAADLVEAGDLVVSVNGLTAIRNRQIEEASRGDSLLLGVVRGGKLLELDLPTRPLDGHGTDRALLWAGTLLQAPHRALASQRGIPREGVYISLWWYGSPADRYGLRATRRIVEVDGQPTPDLDTFLAAVGDRPDRASVRIKTIDLADKVAVTTLKLDLAFWPTSELLLGDDGAWSWLPR